MSLVRHSQHKLYLSVLKHEIPLFLRAFRVPSKPLKLTFSTQKPAKIATLIYENLALTSTFAFVIIFDENKASALKHTSVFTQLTTGRKIKLNFCL
jgi:hypothetical protein